VVEAATAWEYPVMYGYPAPMIDGVNLAELAKKVVIRDSVPAEHAADPSSATKAGERADENR
jgi:hypothetical protein